MDYFKKYDENPFADLFWNIPEAKKLGSVAVVGGNGQSFRVPISVGEFLSTKYPLKDIHVALPDSLKSKMPTLENLIFLKSTDSGTFKDGDEIAKVVDSCDFSLIVGDMSKNSITAQALTGALLKISKPVILTRDAIDLIIDEKMSQILMRDNLIFFGSILQWQKIFKSVYYPKMLVSSGSLMQIAEAFHKFTLSYPTKVVAFFNEQIIVAFNGRVMVVPLEKTGYNAFTLWNGELAAKIMAMNLYNPDKFIEASVAALFK